MNILIATFSIPKDGFAQLSIPRNVQALITKIEKYPNNKELHKTFINETYKIYKNEAKRSSFINDQFEKWMKRYPKVWQLPWSLYKSGYAASKEKELLQTVISINPKHVRSWNSLASRLLIEAKPGNARAVLRNGLQANNNDIDLLYSYARAVKDSSQKMCDSIRLKIIRLYPMTSFAAFAMRDLIEESEDPIVKEGLFETGKQLYQQCSSSKMDQRKQNPWNSVLYQYFSYLLHKNTDDALKLAMNMYIQSLSQQYLWAHAYEVTKKFRQAELLMNVGKNDSALSVLNSIVLNSKWYSNYIIFDDCVAESKMKALDALGRSSEALDTLVSTYAKAPSSRLSLVMQKYGQSHGVDSDSLSRLLKTKIKERSLPADTIKWTKYSDGSSVTLNSLKGKVVLITYWFPNCGPCRAEFPFIEKAIAQFKENPGFVYIGINELRDEDHLVLPLVKQNNLSFLPLQGNISYGKNIGSQGGYPTNYLIDKEGNVAYIDFKVKAESVELLKYRIDSLL